MNYPIPGSDQFISSDAPLDGFNVLLVSYRFHDRLSKNNPAFPTKPWLFKQIIRAIWGPESKKEYVFNPWGEQMIEEFHEWKYLGVCGCASSNKTSTAAVIALVSWLVNPTQTLVLVTSTSIQDSRKRVWGELVNYWQAAGGEQFFPGKLVDSQHMIKTDNGSGVYTDTSGICIIAGEKKKEKEAIGKMIGIKCPNLLLIADELPELSEAIMEAALSNLARNPNFRMVGLGNLISRYDPLGKFVEPEGGWDTVSAETPAWKSKLGYCLRFDGEKSPNVLAGKDIYPFLFKVRDLADMKKNLGPNSIGFWRMVKSFPPPIGAENSVFTEADFVASFASQKVLWLRPPTRLSALDPSFTNGGDRSVATFGSYGLSVDSRMVLQIDEQIVLREDASRLDIPRNEQIVRQWMEHCVRRGVEPNYAGLDAGGGGRVLWDMVARDWSNQVLAVQFGGAASDKRFNANGVAASMAYYNRVSELWYAGVDFLKSGQLKGLTPDLMNELKARRYETVKGEVMKLKVEPKEEMRKRIGFSPDLADSVFILLEVARERCGAAASGPAAIVVDARAAFLAKAKEMDSVYHSMYSEPIF